MPSDKRKTFPLPSPRRILAALAVVTLGVFFRLYPLIVYPEYAAGNKAHIIVYANLQKNIEKYIRLKYAALSPSEQEQLKNKTFRQFLTTEKPKIDALVRQSVQKIRSDEKKEKQPAYLMEVDPYYYLSLTEALVKKGSWIGQIKG